MKYNIIDLFCGCGGFSKGFQDAGHNVLLGIDAWEDAAITYQHNFPNAKVINFFMATPISVPIRMGMNYQKNVDIEWRFFDQQQDVGFVEALSIKGDD